MTQNLARKRIILFLGLLVLIPTAAFLVIKFAQGYRPDFSSWTLRANGLLVATSEPNGAQLFIDNKLVSATNTTLNLAPGTYKVKIKKDGFTSWQKTLMIKKELVTKTEAHLFPTFPDLQPLTFTDVSQPIVSPDGEKVVFTVSGASTGKNGLWVLDLAGRPLGFSREPRQIVKSAPKGRDFALATTRWSPDSSEILVNFANPLTGKEENFLLNASQLNAETGLIDITPTLSLTFRRWEEEKELRQEAQLSKLPEELLVILESSAKQIFFSPDETKIFYTATASASIPEKLVTPLPTTNSQPEARDLETDKVYVYDLKEDKNFYLMAEPEETETKVLQWFPTSKHLFLVQSDKITILEYDNTNWVDVYSGPFEDRFAFPFPTGNKILILTALSQETPPNLYAISLK